MQTDLRSLELGQLKLFWWTLVQEFDSCHSAVKLQFESLCQAIGHENDKIWRQNVDFMPKLQILFSHCS